MSAITQIKYRAMNPLAIEIILAMNIGRSGMEIYWPWDFIVETVAFPARLYSGIN